MDQTTIRQRQQAQATIEATEEYWMDQRQLEQDRAPKRVRFVLLTGWMYKLGYSVDRWNQRKSKKTGQLSLFVSCIGRDGSEHQFYF